MKRLCFLLLAVFLASCESASFTDLVTVSGQVLYHDDFSDPSGGWMQASDANGSLGYADGSYRVQVQAPDFLLWAASGHAYRDVRVEADAVRLAGPLANQLGLVCRFQDVDNFYFFVISSDGYYGIGKMAQGAASLLDQAMMLYSAAVPQGPDPVHLRFDCIGPALTAYVNDQRIATAQDADYVEGDAGVVAGTFDEGGVDVAFDNFVVIKP